MKKALVLSIICFTITFALSWLDVMHPVLLIIKYCTLVFAFSSIAYACVSTHIKKENAGIYWLGVVLLLGYGILTLDTFVFHVLHFVPGIIRYPLYSLYGLPYIVFVVPGIFLCFQKKTG